MLITNMLDWFGQLYINHLLIMQIKLPLPQPSLAWPDPWIGLRTHADQGSGDPSLQHLCYWNVIKENLHVRDMY